MDCGYQHPEFKLQQLLGCAQFDKLLVYSVFVICEVHVGILPLENCLKSKQDDTRVRYKEIWWYFLYDLHRPVSQHHTFFTYPGYLSRYTHSSHCPWAPPQHQVALCIPRINAHTLQEWNEKKKQHYKKEHNLLSFSTSSSSSVRSDILQLICSD